MKPLNAAVSCNPSRTQLLFLAVALTTVLLLLAACTSPGESGITAIVGAQLEPSLDAEPIPFSVVVVANGIIQAAGPQQTTPVPKGAETIRGAGMLILPMPYTATIAPGEPANLMIRDSETRAPKALMRDGVWIN